MRLISFINNNIDSGGVRDVSGWKDVKHVCGKCKVLADDMDDEHRTCNAYCAANGLQCKAAWDEQRDTCTEEREENCNFQFGNETDDAICECIPKRGVFYILY